MTNVKLSGSNTLWYPSVIMSPQSVKNRLADHYVECISIFFLSFESNYNILKGTYFGEISKKKGLGKFWGGF